MPGLWTSGRRGLQTEPACLLALWSAALAVHVAYPWSFEKRAGQAGHWEGLVFLVLGKLQATVFVGVSGHFQGVTVVVNCAEDTGCLWHQGKRRSCWSSWVGTRHQWVGMCPTHSAVTHTS